MLLVRDRVTASRPVTAISRLHLHPECVVEELSRRRARIRHPGGVFSVTFDGEGELALEASTLLPRVRAAIDARALAFTTRAAVADFGFCIAHGAADAEFALASGARVRDRRYPW